ncbi:uncharacterized protein LOC125369922 [Ricinus communis]|uniref:uncharacterized protein LOC125369922 n=1 Tax=Ricinus communis TaxID=3988 RepID=UPI00201A77D4|nr:uncharacterized protein LOC125369922 [Ricinus communis]
MTKRSNPDLVDPLPELERSLRQLRKRLNVEEEEIQVEKAIDKSELEDTTVEMFDDDLMYDTERDGSSSGGSLSSKTPEQAQSLIEEMATNNSNGKLLGAGRDVKWRNNNNKGPLGFRRLHQQLPQSILPPQSPQTQEKEPNLEELMMKFVDSSKKVEDNKAKKEEAKKIPLREYHPKISYPARLKCLGDLTISDALAYLGASINVISYNLFAKLGLGETKPTTRMSIQLVDRSVKHPRGIVENVLVKVDKFIFPVDFVILDMDGENSVAFILGRPFLATSRAIIDVYDGKLELRVGDETVTFDLNNSMK